jgi:hypothetical protein
MSIIHTQIKRSLKFDLSILTNIDISSKIILLFLLLFLYIFVGTVFSFDPLSVEFQKTSYESGSVKTAKGIAFLCTKDHVHIKVYYPLNQIMDINANVMKIFYPDDNIAMKIISDSPFSLPLIQAFVATFSENFGLSDLGFCIDRSYSKEDTLYTIWKPPKALKQEIKEFTIAFLKDHIVFTRLKNNKDMTRTSIFENYHTVGSISYPAKVTTRELYKGKENGKDVILYSNLKFESELPSEVCHFTFPDSTKVQEIHW